MSSGGNKRTKNPANIEVLNPDDWEGGLRFALKTLNTKTVTRAKTPEEVLLVCLRHNLRKENEDHRHRRPIDPARTANNTVLRGSTDPSMCAAMAASILEGLNIKPARCDSIMGVELVIQPPPGSDTEEFYEEGLNWTARRYAYVVSAVVHRDQKRPHLHVLALAVCDGRLDGASMTSQVNRLQAQRSDFMVHMRKTLHLRPDREPKSKAKSKSMVSIFTSTGKGPKSREVAARRDAELARRTQTEPREHTSTSRRTHDLLAQQPHSPSDLMAPTSSWAPLTLTFRQFESWAASAAFPGTQTASFTTAALSCLTMPEPAVRRDDSGTPGIKVQAGSSNVGAVCLSFVPATEGQPTECWDSSTPT